MKWIRRRGSFVRLRFEKGKQNIHSILLFSDKSFSFFCSWRFGNDGVRWNFFMHWQIDRKVFIFLLLERAMLMKMMKWRFGAHLQFALSSSFFLLILTIEHSVGNLLSIIMKIFSLSLFSWCGQTLLQLFFFCYKIKLNKWWQSCIYVVLNEWMNWDW